MPYTKLVETDVVRTNFLGEKKKVHRYDPLRMNHGQAFLLLEDLKLYGEPINLFRKPCCDVNNFGNRWLMYGQTAEIIQEDSGNIFLQWDITTAVNAHDCPPCNIMYCAFPLFLFSSKPHKGHDSERENVGSYCEEVVLDGICMLSGSAHPR